MSFSGKQRASRGDPAMLRSPACDEDCPLVRTAPLMARDLWQAEGLWTTGKAAHEAAIRRTAACALPVSGKRFQVKLKRRGQAAAPSSSRRKGIVSKFGALHAPATIAIIDTGRSRSAGSAHFCLHVPNSCRQRSILFVVVVFAVAAQRTGARGGVDAQNRRTIGRDNQRVRID